MTDAEGDLIMYWRRKCDICIKEYPLLYAKCKEDSYRCKADKIDVYR